LLLSTRAGGIADALYAGCMGENDCRLYLLTPPALPPDFPDLLAAALDAAEVAALRLNLPGVSDDGLARAVELVRPVTEARGVALVLEGAPSLAVRTGCDGVHFAWGEWGVVSARRILGEGLQLGVFCGESRDLAMRAGEDGADYVGFGPFAGGADDAASDVLGWWAELMELPVVAEGAASAGACASLASAGADFVAVGDFVWRHAAGPAAAMRALRTALVSA
jgi:thiamine-phosphate pyrophosphorylase